MKELQELFTTRLTEYLASGAIESKIDEAITKCFDDCIDSAFRYGDLHKAIKEIVTEKMRVSADQVDIPSYNAVLEQALRQQVAVFSDGAAADMFSAAIAGLFETAPEEITMFDLADKLLTDMRENNDDQSDYGEYYTVSFEPTDYEGYMFIIEGGKYSPPVVNLYLAKCDGGHHRIAINHEMDLTNPTSLYGHDRWLFLLYAGKTRILDCDMFDPDDLDTRKVDADY